MGAIGGLLGIGGGASGSGFAAPQGAPIWNPTNATQINQSYTGAVQGLSAQDQLLQALQAQNGLQNQSQIYGQLQGIANGTGPNPAQTMLNQATGQNVANQAALMAGQRGSGANVGLIARQAAQQGANTQQQAAGQGATMQAQQALGAIGTAGQMANTQAQQQIGATEANTQAQMAEQQALLNAQQGFNNNLVGMQSNINSANAGLAQTGMQGQQGLIGGVLNAGGAAAGLGKAAGGDIVKMAGGGDPAQQPGPSSYLGKYLKSNPFQMGSAVNNQTQSQAGQAFQMAPTSGAQSLQKGANSAISGLLGALQGSPQVQDSDSTPGDNSASMIPQMASNAAMAKGGGVHDYRSGGKVKAKGPGQKAVAAGNNYANDKIPAVLSEHEIVLPRNVTMSKDPVGESAKFVAAVIAKRQGKRG